MAHFHVDVQSPLQSKPVKAACTKDREADRENITVLIPLSRELCNPQQTIFEHQCPHPEKKQMIYKDLFFSCSLDFEL